jgi:outer membrane phospholipase A
VFPFQTYELQAATTALEETALLIVKSKYAVESQPCTEPPAKNTEYVPEVLYVFPFQTYELQAATTVLDETALLIVKSKYAVESHPCTEPPAKNAEYVPEVLYVFPFQTYELQAATTVLDKTALLIVKSKYAVESQPCTEPPAKNTEYVPEVLYVFPFQMYELQAAITVLDETALLIVKSRYAVESQPCTEPPAKNTEYVPEVLYVFPFQMYELQAAIIVFEVL